MIASLRVRPLASAVAFGVDQLAERRREVRLAGRSRPRDGASRDSPRCVKKSCAEYGHCLISALKRSIESAVSRFHRIAVRHLDRGCEHARRATSVPYSASITRSPPGVPGVTAASGPYSGGYSMSRDCGRTPVSRRLAPRRAR